MPHEEQREKNIRLVTEKALDCFLENGIEKTKIADIARLSELTERSVFRYFETKADLVLAASLLYWNRVLERIDRMLREDSPEGSTTGLEDAAKLFVCYSRLYRVDPKGMRFTLDAELTLHSAGRLHEIRNQPPEPYETSNGPMARPSGRVWRTALSTRMWMCGRFTTTPMTQSWGSCSGFPSAAPPAPESWTMTAGCSI